MRAFLTAIVSLSLIGCIAHAQSSGRAAPKAKAKAAPAAANMYVPIESAIIYEIENSPAPMMGLNKAYLQSLGPNQGQWRTNATYGTVDAASNPAGVMYEIDFDAANVTCRATSSDGRMATCTYDLSTTGMLRWAIRSRNADYIVADLAQGPVRRTDRFVKVGDQWTSPDLRNTMLRSMSNVQASGNSGNGAQSQLCRALGAGVLATGGSAEAQRTYNAGGC